MRLTPRGLAYILLLVIYGMLGTLLALSLTLEHGTSHTTFYTSEVCR